MPEQNSVNLEKMLRGLGEQARRVTPKKANNKEPADLNKIISVYESILADEEADFDDFYDAANSLIANKETIYKFVSLLPKYEKEKKFYETGGFLSGLINNLEENEEVVLDLSNLNELMVSLGMRLHSRSLRIKGNVGWGLGCNVHSGKIIVEGNAEDSVGMFMQDGEILIKGNVGSYLGHLKDSGKIIVEGNAEDRVGIDMLGGKIIVEGNAGKYVGQGIEGGEIHINGNYESISKKIKGGAIYHKGKRISP